MQESIINYIDNASECMRRIETMLEKVDPSKIKPLTAAVEEALQHLQKASKASFQQQVDFALSPDCFSPFNLVDVGRAYSRFALHEPSRTVMLLKHVSDRNHEEDPKPASERMEGLIVVYTISSDLHSQSFVLHGSNALTSYQDDEADVRKSQPGSAPLIANHGVRRRLLAAKTAPPGDMDLENVATVVEHALGSKVETADIIVNSWYCLNTKYVLDIVKIWALVQARRRVLEVPGIGDRKSLVEEDLVSKYFTIEGAFDEA